MPQPLSVIERRSEILSKDKVKKEYTFDSFAVGKNSREAYAAALFVYYYPGKFNNPLFIFENSDLGKTNLLHVIGNYIEANRVDEKTLYIYSKDFVTLLTEAMENRTAEDIKETTCLVDYLLIDNTQRLKQSTPQEVLLNMYNKLTSDNKQVVVTSDIHPIELKGIGSRLISRLPNGLSVSVGSPGSKTAKAILQKKMEGHNDEIMIDSEVPDYLTTCFANDVRKLEGMPGELFFKVMLYNPGRIDITFAGETFRENPIVVKQEDELAPKRVKNAVYEYYSPTRTQIESESRTKNIVNARHTAIYLYKTHLEMPFAKVGFEFGNCDYSTIMSSYERMMKLLKEKETFQQAAMQIEGNLGVK